MPTITLFVKERTGPHLWSALAGGDIDYQSGDYATVYLAAEAALAWARQYEDRAYDSIHVKLAWEGDETAAEMIDLHFERRGD